MTLGKVPRGFGVYTEKVERHLLQSSTSYVILPCVLDSWDYIWQKYHSWRMILVSQDRVGRRSRD